jgi:outer membrane protein assembly factor BamB
MVFGRFLALGLSLGLVSAAVQAGDWPQFRGPNGGVSDERQLPVEWGGSKNVRWKVRIPGYGWSSPIVWGDKVLVTTAVGEKQKAPLRKGPGKGEDAPPEELYRWEVHCLDAATGKTMWKQVAAERKPPIATHLSNTYASETPVTDGERVYAYFGMVGVFCYDLSGKLLWSKDLGAYRMQGNWGTSSSPALDGQRLFIQCDNNEPGLFTSGAVLALRTILFSRTDSHFASLIPPHPIGEAADMAKNADSAAKNRLFPC